jgi:hypothetical protein
MVATSLIAVPLLYPKRSQQTVKCITTSHRSKLFTNIFWLQQGWIKWTIYNYITRNIVFYAGQMLCDRIVNSVGLWWARHVAKREKQQIKKEYFVECPPVKLRRWVSNVAFLLPEMQPSDISFFSASWTAHSSGVTDIGCYMRDS